MNIERVRISFTLPPFTIHHSLFTCFTIHYLRFTLLDRNAFCQIPWLIYIVALCNTNMVSQ